MTTPAPIRVLILEDSPADAELMLRELRNAGLEVQAERVDSETEFAARLAPELDLILSDFQLPQFGGLEALRLLRSRGLDVPFIIVSGSIGEDIAVAAMREGADDYLLKDRVARLGQAALKAIENRRLRGDMRRAEAQVRENNMTFLQIGKNVKDLF
jgi:CheY-like chemotaxis protein